MASNGSQPSPALVSLRVVCAILGYHRDTAYRHIRAGTFPIPPQKIMGRWAFRQTDVDRLVGGVTVDDR